MRAKEFYKELAKTGKGWKVDHWGFLRQQGGFCPITAACMKVTGNYFAAESFAKAGKVLGLKFPLVLRISDAADCAESKSANRMRKQLLKAVGLEEQ